MVLGLGLVFGSLGACAGLDAYHMQVTKDVAFEEARRLSGDKGIINLGAGPRRFFGAKSIANAPEVLVNVDIDTGDLPNLIQLDLQYDPLPFPDKCFGCAFASHVLEHLDNWQFALSEMVRVADFVVLVLPDPTYFSGWLSPEHKQHFTAEDIDQITELYPEVLVYY